MKRVNFIILLSIIAIGSLVQGQCNATACAICDAGDANLCETCNAGYGFDSFAKTCTAC